MHTNLVHPGTLWVTKGCSGTDSPLIQLYTVSWPSLPSPNYSRLRSRGWGRGFKGNFGTRWPSRATRSRHWFIHCKRKRSMWGWGREGRDLTVSVYELLLRLRNNLEKVGTIELVYLHSQWKIQNKIEKSVNYTCGKKSLASRNHNLRKSHAHYNTGT